MTSDLKIELAEDFVFSPESISPYPLCGISWINTTDEFERVTVNLADKKELERLEGFIKLIKGGNKLRVSNGINLSSKKMLIYFISNERKILIPFNTKNVFFMSF